MNYKYLSIILSITTGVFGYLTFAGPGVFARGVALSGQSQATTLGHDGHQMEDGTIMPNTMNMQAGGMDAAMGSMVADMQGKTGEALEKAFLSGMIMHHEGAIDMAQLLLTGTKKKELVQMANGIITAQTKEISQMKQWLAEYK